MTNQGRTKMKKLLITLLLISPFSFADLGDVYYCETIANQLILSDGKSHPVESVRFKFTLNEVSEYMVFGSLPLLWRNQKYPLASLGQSPDGMVFKTLPRHGSNMQSTFNFIKGQLFGVGFSAYNSPAVYVFVADCDKF